MDLAISQPYPFHFVLLLNAMTIILGIFFMLLTIIEKKLYHPLNIQFRDVYIKEAVTASA